MDHWKTARTSRQLGARLTAMGQEEQDEPLLISGYDGLESALGPGTETGWRRWTHWSGWTTRGEDPGTPTPGGQGETSDVLVRNDGHGSQHTRQQPSGRTPAGHHG
ncbi:MAG: hypothetical protein ACYTGD_04140, partial [Planctomycetota bacterium]